jgi:hypothetical protein
MAEIKSIVEPYCILDDDRWKSVSFVDILIFHSTIVAELQLTCQYRKKCRALPARHFNYCKLLKFFDFAGLHSIQIAV